VSKDGKSIVIYYVCEYGWCLLYYMCLLVRMVSQLLYIMSVSKDGESFILHVSVSKDGKSIVACVCE